MGEDHAIDTLPGDQCELFGPGDIPEQPEMVKACKQYLHTGKIILKDRQRCEDVMSALLAGIPVTTVMKTFSIGYQSIRRIQEELERTGKLESLKQREHRQLMQLGSLAKEHLISRLIDGKIQDNVAAVVMGISYQRAGEMGSEEEEGGPKTDDDVGSREDWEKRFQAAKQALASAPIDVPVVEQSTDKQGDSQ